ncbi:DNA-processing protein DprA [Flavimarina sp. Hel_I_48]|uniref:DNA-processing protein DprA n=1 Tax=Flavimarina sp. Hel_I_48 TaxID=1392488 RepID=UPI0004DF3BED|nr:DNA-processing protein DprA [Flavimarina sp. Hel_I_48]
MTENELIALLTLQRVPNLGDASIKKLIHHTGSAEALFKEKPANLLRIDGIGTHKIKELHASEHKNAALEELRFITENKITCTAYTQPGYPDRLKHCIDGPILLFKRGNIDLSNRRMLSIVGTRKVTPHGIAQTQKLIEELAVLNPVIISGFAYGVDITAHRAALQNNLQTIGVVAHGLNQIYPKVHKKYMQEVEENGGFISDFWSSDPFDRKNFLRRNRIIAGMSEATIVIESAAKGGSLVTADIANSYNREVFAMPGRPGDSQSIGCNNLIKTQQARLITSAADVVYVLNWDLKEDLAPVQKQLFIDLNEEEERLYTFLNKNGKEELDFIALHCNFPTYKTAGLLLNMEIKGVVRPLPGKRFELT